MQVVIEIDDKLYNRIKYLEPKSNTMLDELMRSVQNGTPLPKGHGRLGDLDKLEKDMYNGIMAGMLEEGYDRYTRIFSLDDCVERVQWADTIIEADKEG